MSVKLPNTLTFSDEQSMLLDTAVHFFRDKAPMAYVRNQLTTDQGYDSALWTEMVALGWIGLAIPEEYGGSGLGLAEAVTIAEPMGRHLFTSPFLSTQLFIQGILAGGNEQQQQRFLNEIANGSIGTVALTEQSGHWDLQHIASECINRKGAFALTGTKSFVTDADVANIALVSVRLASQPALAIVSRSDLAQLRRETIIDETRRSYEVALDGITLSQEQLITGDAALRALNAIRDAALLLIAAEQAGGIAGVLEVVVDYLNTRTAFGRKIGGYQALKHPSVDILVGLERARSHVYHAASLIAQGDPAEVALRMAKAEASDAFAFAGDRAIQFHGGFGFTYECDAQLYLRRALWTQYAYGDAAHHRKQLAQLLL